VTDRFQARVPDEWKTAIAADGYAFVPAAAMRKALDAAATMPDWPAFAASWNTLGLDTYMADQGRYRRRRHAVFSARAGGGIVREPHQPHYQTLDYNALNGGVERWFDPIDPTLGDGASLRTLLGFCRDLFGSLAPQVAHWRIEAHQFRIEARPGEPGQPTPEGMHRDGVDYVLVLLVRRDNIASGTTLIGGSDGGFTSSFTLVEPFDAAWVDDQRVHHGVTAVEPLDPAKPAYRDVLVLTFRRG
jgi:hypothetical protein